MIDVDLVQRIKVGGTFLLELYKVGVGCMLTLFVPQACGDEICTFQQNYEKTAGYNRTALITNGLSLLMFVFSYGVELRRENWAIHYLDVDYDKPDNSLKEIIRGEPELDKKMDRLNKIYYYTLLTTSGVYVVNLGLMGKILYDDYHSMSTVSCTASFALLVLMKLYNSLCVARVSIKQDEMRSAFLKEFTSFNVLDVDYVKQKYGTESRSESGVALEDVSVEIPESKP
tara:strand:- start:1740 stop:2426 length:687 start_codon:yes stop_codon:yes gene_type:complete